jgi:hypothetical protein
MQIIWRSPRLRQVIFAVEVDQSTHGRIYAYVQFGHRTIWLRRSV